MDVISEANRIKERLRACQDGAEVEAVAAEERDTVMGWKGQPGDVGVMFIHILNLKNYMVSGFSAQTKGRAA